jgi:ABC-type nitrate/sulfonate/bicarbonate transport system permease component
MFNPYIPLSSKARIGLGITTGVFVLTVWSILAGFDLVSQAKLPAPWEVAQALYELSWDADKGKSLLLTATLASLSRIGLATLAVVCTGIPVGILMGSAPKVNAILSPLLDPFRSAPIVAVLPILVMWLGIDESMKVVFLWAGAFPYLVPMVRDSIQAVPRDYFIKIKDLGGSDLEAIRLGVIPAAMPRIADAVIVSVSIMWTYITVAEYVNAKSGLGQLIQNARRFSAMDQVFAGILVIIVLAFVTFFSMKWAKTRMFSWETS